MATSPNPVDYGLPEGWVPADRAKLALDRETIKELPEKDRILLYNQQLLYNQNLKILENLKKVAHDLRSNSPLPLEACQGQAARVAQNPSYQVVDNIRHDLSDLHANGKDTDGGLGGGVPSRGDTSAKFVENSANSATTAHHAQLPTQPIDASQKDATGSSTMPIDHRSLGDRVVPNEQSIDFAHTREPYPCNQDNQLDPAGGFRVSIPVPVLKSMDTSADASDQLLAEEQASEALKASGVRGGTSTIDQPVPGSSMSQAELDTGAKHCGLDTTDDTEMDYTPRDSQFTQPDHDGPRSKGSFSTDSQKVLAFGQSSAELKSLSFNFDSSTLSQSRELLTSPKFGPSKGLLASPAKFGESWSSKITRYIPRPIKSLWKNNQAAPRAASSNTNVRPSSNLADSVMSSNYREPTSPGKKRPRDQSSSSPPSQPAKRAKTGPMLSTAEFDTRKAPFQRAASTGFFGAPKDEVAKPDSNIQRRMSVGAPHDKGAERLGMMTPFETIREPEGIPTPTSVVPPKRAREVMIISSDDDPEEELLRLHHVNVSRYSPFRLQRGYIPVTVGDGPFTLQVIRAKNGEARISVALRNDTINMLIQDIASVSNAPMDTTTGTALTIVLKIVSEPGNPYTTYLVVTRSAEDTRRLRGLIARLAPPGTPALGALKRATASKGEKSVKGPSGTQASFKGQGSGVVKKEQQDQMLPNDQEPIVID